MPRHLRPSSHGRRNARGAPGSALAILLIAASVAVAPSAALPPNLVALFLDNQFGFGTTHALSADGRRALIESNSDLTGSNPDKNNEIFLWDREEGFRQLTETSGQVFHWRAELNANGTKAALLTDADLTNSGAGSKTELYRWVEGAGWSRLTVTAGVTPLVFPGAMAMSDDGALIVFSSRDDYVETNPSGEMQVFLWQTEGFTQLTNASPCGGSGGNFAMDISGNGQRILFSSRCQRGALNTDLGSDLYLLDGLDLISLTDEPTPVGASGTLDWDGSVAALRSGNDLVNGGFGSATHLYRWIAGEGFERLTTQGIAGDQPSVNADGSRIAFAAENGQGLGVNPEGASEVFLWQAPRGSIRALTDSQQTDDFFGNDFESGNLAAWSKLEPPP